LIVRHFNLQQQAERIIQYVSRFEPEGMWFLTRPQVDEWLQGERPN
jgi:hypothetical protein